MPLQLPDLAALATAEANGFMGMQHALQYGQLQLPPDFATANALGVNVPVALDPSQRHSQEQLAHQMDGRASHPGQLVCCYLPVYLKAYSPPATSVCMQPVSCKTFVPAMQGKRKS